MDSCAATARSRANVEDVLLRWRREKLGTPSKAEGALAHNGGTATEEDVDVSAQQRSGAQQAGGSGKKKRARRDSGTRQAKEEPVAVRPPNVSFVHTAATMEVVLEEVSVVQALVEAVVVVKVEPGPDDGAARLGEAEAMQPQGGPSVADMEPAKPGLEGKDLSAATVVEPVAAKLEIVVSMLRVFGGFFGLLT
jgi:hypothetical protein